MKKKISLIRAAQLTMEDISENFWVYLIMSVIAGFVYSMVFRAMGLIFGGMIATTVSALFFDLYVTGIYMGITSIGLSRRHYRHSTNEIFYFFNNFEEFIEFYKVKLSLLAVSLPFLFMSRMFYLYIRPLNFIKPFFDINFYAVRGSVIDMIWMSVMNILPGSNILIEIIVIVIGIAMMLLFVRLFFALFYLIHKNRSVKELLKYSFKLTEGNSVHLVIIFVILQIVLYILTLIANFILAKLWLLQGIFGDVPRFFIQGFMAILFLSKIYGMLLYGTNKSDLEIIADKFGK